jgi:hypothetical protein
MKTSTPRSLRALFLTLMLLLGVYAAAEAVLAPAPSAEAAEGLTACGTEADPCRLEAVAVEASPSGEHLAAGPRVRRAMRMRI